MASAPFTAQHRVHPHGGLLLHERPAGAVVATVCSEANAVPMARFYQVGRAGPDQESTGHFLWSEVRGTLAQSVCSFGTLMTVKVPARSVSQDPLSPRTDQNLSINHHLSARSAPPARLHKRRARNLSFGEFVF